MCRSDKVKMYRVYFYNKKKFWNYLTKLRTIWHRSIYKIESFLSRKFDKKTIIKNFRPPTFGIKFLLFKKFNSA